MGTGLQLLKRYKIKRALVCALKENRRCNTGIKCFFPSPCTQAPAIACFQAGKSVFWAWGAEVVASLE